MLRENRLLFAKIAFGSKKLLKQNEIFSATNKIRISAHETTSMLKISIRK
jgi:hypothetical protein